MPRSFFSKLPEAAGGGIVELLVLIAGRPVVIALAVLGAIVATLGSWLVRRPGRLGERGARFVLRLGYGLTGASVALFIVAGFLPKP